MLCFFFARFKTKRELQKTYLLPLMLTFIPINSELRNFSNDQMTANVLIINALIGHYSLVISYFCFHLMFAAFSLCLWLDFCVMEVCLKFEKFCIV